MSLSESVTKVGEKAFAGCTALEKLVLPKSLKEIGYGILEGDENLRVLAYRGSQNDWTKVTKHKNWNSGLYIGVTEYNSKL